MGNVKATELANMRFIHEPKPTLAKVREDRIRRLGKKIASLVVVDRDLPTAMISRYLATVCLSGIEANPADLRSRRDWVETLNRVLKTEIMSRTYEDKDGKEDSFKELSEMFEASGLMNELEKEIEEAEREDPVECST